MKILASALCRVAGTSARASVIKVRRSLEAVAASLHEWAADDGRLPWRRRLHAAKLAPPHVEVEAKGSVGSGGVNKTIQTLGIARLVATPVTHHD